VVREAVVVARGTAADRRLIAYVIPAEPDQPAAEMRQALRAALAERLPAYMVPADFVPVASWPLTPSGKVDRRGLALHGPEPDPAEAVAAEPPRTPAEEVLAGIWAEVLGRERVGRDQKFFDIGGHSLLALRVVTRVRAVFQVELPLRGLFERPTVEGLAKVIADLVGGPDIADEISLIYKELQDLSEDEVKQMLD
jgi:acyl carrier protein